MERAALVDLDPTRAVAPPTALETHISVVLFAGSRAYKICKPVSLGFVDFSTLAKRRVAISRELEVNRRFAPDVYLGFIDLVDETGVPQERALVMQRLPHERRLSLLLTSHGAESLVQQVARRVASIHSVAPRSAQANAAATVEASRKNWNDNFASIEPFVGTVIAPAEFRAVREAAHAYLAGRAPLFDRRIAAGHVVDGHGDLLTDDIFCIEDGPRILDALAFNDELRYGDVLNDIAFLAMDIERRADAELAQRLLTWYCEYSGETHPTSLAHFYIAYRAHVRAKVACLRSAQGDELAAERAARDHALCWQHLDQAGIRFVLVGGPPGTGKSTVAGELAHLTGWTILSSDEIRKDIAGLPHDADASAPLGEGIYRPEAADATYREVISRAERLAGLGQSVILDASWSSEAWRQAARESAERTHSFVVELRCDAPQPIAEQRIAQRRARGPNVSDATVDVAHLLRDRFEPWLPAAVLDTTEPIDASVAKAWSFASKRGDS